MALILEIGFASHQRYVEEYLRAFFDDAGVVVNVSRIAETILVETDESHPQLEAALNALNEQMPYSCFMTGVSHRISEAPFQQFDATPRIPVALNLGVCARCTKEMLDPGSRRYYYPFTACRHCGSQYAFFEGYPYERAHTSWRALPPCAACETESQNNPYRRGFALIGCEACGPKLAASEPTGTGAQRKARFEAAARQIASGGAAVIRTTFGYRRFYRPGEGAAAEGAVLLHLNAKSLMQHCSLTRQEIEALYSMERPMLKVALQDETLRSAFGAFALCKVPDEGFTVLLAHELLECGIDYVAFEPCDASADAAIAFGETLYTQSEMRLFVAGERTRMVVSGERVSFPAQFDTPVDTLSMTPALVAIKEGRTHRVDRMEHFEGATASKMNVLEGFEPEIAHSNTRFFAADEGAFAAAMVSNRIRSNAVGVYFEGDTVSFLYAKNTHPGRVVPAVAFEPEKLIATLASLREGSQRMVENLQRSRPELYALLQQIETGRMGFFDAVAAVIGTEKPGFDGVDSEALKFMGKGGTQVDTVLGDSRFNPYACIASLISYKMAGVEPVMLAYSLFESLGDYFVDILTQLIGKTRAEHVVLCGAGMAQASLYGRITQKMKQPAAVLNRSFPVGSQSAVVGGIYL